MKSASALCFTACDVDPMKEREQLWVERLLWTMEYLEAYTPERSRVLGKGLAPETKCLFFVGCYHSPSCLLPQHSAEDAFSRPFP